MFTRATAVVFALMLTAGISRPLAGASSSVPSDEAAVIHALNRLTFGIRAGDVARVKAMGLEKWIDLQLSPSRIDDKAMAVKLARLETLTLDSATIQRDYSGPAMVERRERKAEQGADQPDAMPMRDMPNGARGPVSETQRKDRQVMADIEEAKLLRAIYSERQLEEVLVDFWFNHFNVFAGKGATRNYLTEYEREAIRPYVLGNFRDMLEATAKSPAMLFYLDNWQNVAPQSAETGLRRRSGGFPARTRPGGPSPTSAGGASPSRPQADPHERRSREP
jgi:uncharacterized protein (DUF1800 family)